VFVVADHMDEKRARDVMAKRWFKNYDQSVRKHFRDYKRRRKKKRTMYGSDKHWRLHILLGHKTESFWMGKSGIDLTRYQE
jgi:hypothetical protein